jgi:hypothetical protein
MPVTLTLGEALLGDAGLNHPSVYSMVVGKFELLVFVPGCQTAGLPTLQ